MSALKAVGKPGQEEDVAQVHRIRITLTLQEREEPREGYAAALATCFSSN